MNTKKHVVGYFDAASKSTPLLNSSSPICLTPAAVTGAQDIENDVCFLQRRNEKSISFIKVVQRLKKRGCI